MISFVFDVKRFHHEHLHPLRIHNLRERYASSQLPTENWFFREGKKTISPWRQDRLDLAHRLASRRGCIECVGIVIQFGSQLEWRAHPTPDNIFGDILEPINLAEAGVAIKNWAENEFGPENIVSIELHGDESTPHFHVMATPIFQGKLQVSHWLHKKSDLINLRARAHKTIHEVVPCHYQPLRNVSLDHDPRKAAGGIFARKPSPEVGIFGRLCGEDLRLENEKLKLENVSLQRDLHELRRQARQNYRGKLHLEEKQKLREENKQLKRTMIHLCEDNDKMNQTFHWLAELPLNQLTDTIKQVAEEYQNGMRIAKIRSTVDTIENARVNGEINTEIAANSLLKAGPECVEFYIANYRESGPEVIAQLSCKPPVDLQSSPYASASRNLTGKDNLGDSAPCP